MAYRTFTDIIVLDPAGRLHIGRALTTPDRILEGMGGTLAVVAGDRGMAVAALPA